MSDVPTSLTTGNNDGNGPYTTASVAPSADHLVCIAIEWGGAGVTINTVTGGGMTGNWVQIGVSSQGSRTTAIYRHMEASPGSGTITVSFTGTATGGTWSVFEIGGVDTGGTKGSAAVAQFKVATGAGSPATVTQDATPNSAHTLLSATGLNTQNAVTPGGGYTELHADLLGAAPNRLLQVQYDTTAPADGISDCTFSAGGWDIVAFEIKDVVAGGGPTQVNTGFDGSVVDPDVLTFGFTASAGNLLVVDIFTLAISIATPTGWTLNESIFNATENDFMARWSKISDGTETTFAVDLSAAVAWAGIVREWTGMTQTVHKTDNTPRTVSVTSLEAGAVTTTEADVLLFAAVGKRDTTTAESWDELFINLIAHEQAGASKKARIVTGTRLATATGSFSPTNSWTTATTAMGMLTAYLVEQAAGDVEFTFGNRFK